MNSSVIKTKIDCKIQSGKIIIFHIVGFICLRSKIYGLKSGNYSEFKLEDFCKFQIMKKRKL